MELLFSNLSNQETVDIRVENTYNDVHTSVKETEKPLLLGYTNTLDFISRFPGMFLLLHAPAVTKKGVWKAAVFINWFS